MLRNFSGGAQLGQELLDYFACCRWEKAAPGKAKGGTWLELASDFEVATGANLKPPLFRRKGHKPLVRTERNRSAEQKAYLMHRYVDELEAQLKRRCGDDRLHPGEAVRRVDTFRELGVRWTAGLTHRACALGGSKTAATLAQLFLDTGNTERKRARGAFIQKASNDPKGPAQQARTKATAWASKTAFAFPQGRTSLEELGLRTAPNQLARPPRMLRRGPGLEARMASRRALRRGELVLSADEATESISANEEDGASAPDPLDDSAAQDVPMEEEPVSQQAAPDIPMEEWSAEQVIANGSLILRGGLDDEEGDEEEPDWEDADPEDEPEQLPPEEENFEEDPEQGSRPPSRFMRDTRALFDRWRAEAYAPPPRRPVPPRLHLWCTRPEPDKSHDVNERSSFSQQRWQRMRCPTETCALAPPRQEARPKRMEQKASPQRPPHLPTTRMRRTFRLKVSGGTSNRDGTTDLMASDMLGGKK